MVRLIVTLIQPFLILLLLTALLPPNTCAEGINPFMEHRYSNFVSESKNKETGVVTESKYSDFLQRYYLDVSKTIYPLLVFKGGGIFELDDSTSTSQNVDAKREETLFRPFVELNLNNPLYTGQIGYRLTEIKEDTTANPTTRNFKEDLNAFAGWNPVDFPHFNLRVTRTHNFNDPETVDSVEDLADIICKYEPLEDLLLRYSYTRTERENTIQNSKLLTQVQNGSANYSGLFLEKRLQLNTGLRASYLSREFSRSENGTGEIITSSLLPSAGLSSLDETPEDGPALDPNTALIDSNLEASSGINMGLDGDETTFANIGLDFGVPVSVDTVFIWIDRRLPSAVVDSFSWSVYTNPDNTDTSTWTLHSTGLVAAFGVFQNRFEITFPSVETRFIKIVARPLSPGVIGASTFPEIFVTEIEAFTTLSDEEGQNSQENRNEAFDLGYNLNMVGRINDKTTLGYSLYYRLNETDPASEKKTSLSNGIYTNHVFNKVFTGSARLFRDDRDSTDDETITYSYSSSVRAAYLDTFRQTLGYSGTHIKEKDGSSYTNSVFLRNFANLYKGWDLLLDAGNSWNRTIEGTRGTSTIIRLQTNVVPNDKIIINLNYTPTWTKERDNNGESSQFRQTAELQTTLSPFTNLHFFSRLTVRDVENSSDVLQNYSANWSPFPQGTLQFFFAYNERLRSENDQLDRTVGPTIKWTISRHASLEMSYSLVKTDSLSQITDSKNFNTFLRISF